MTEQNVPALDEATRSHYEAALYGLMAYRELTAFERLSSDARFSPALADREALARLAVAEFAHFELVRARIEEDGGDVQEAMRPFAAEIDALHERTRPGDWYESLMKAYVIDSVAGDFYQAVALALDPRARQLVAEVQSMDAQTGWLRDRLRGALADDPRLASRLALWGRRLLGEALTGARRIGDRHDFWNGLVELADAEARAEHVARLFATLVENHSRRMSELGLTA
ncbi:ferritin-like fold-containing protein [Zafaria sp. Z1313]|uniref:ferritin-like fold-containing protein n=1 Tax=unclassified Zafaria TaxID=2828765 RepID=UPI002E78687F|nr:ferritin-like fold-containing protein [Zafaria sp. J156]MEE1620374.1 ferritin-like fold-containing protein [Zafaria sp. J156]